MFRNYLKIAIRNLKRHKLYSFINIAGLAVGISVCIIVFLYTHYELSFDTFYPDANHLYRVVLHLKYPGGESTIGLTPAALGPALKENYPDVKREVRVYYTTRKKVITVGEHSFIERKYTYADPGFFQLFAFGKIPVKSLLSGPNSVVLTKSTAEKYFHQADPVGRTIKVDGHLKKVTGVVSDFPDNSSIHYDIVESLAGTEAYESHDWGANDFVTYLKISPKADIGDLQKRITQITRKNKGDISSPGYNHSVFLQSVPDIHLGRGVPGEESNVRFLYQFAILALFILLIAGINFVNLLTSLSIDRMHEIGLRKVMGAFPKQLILQFLGEAVLTTFLAMILSLILTYVFLPLANDLSGAAMNFSMLFSESRVASLLIFTFFVGIAAGIYPAFILTRNSPATIMGGNQVSKLSRRKKSRNVLVIFQYATAIALIIASIVVYHQLQFLHDKDLGFKKDNVALIPNADKMKPSTRQVVKHSLKEQPGVRDVSIAYSVPGQFFITTIFAPVDKNSKIEHQISYTFVDDNYIRTLGIPVIEGRSFGFGFNDSLSVLLNQSAAQILFGQKDPVGKEIRFASGYWGKRVFRVVGIVKDFNFNKLKYRVSPLALFNLRFQPYRAKVFAVSIKSGDRYKALNNLRKSWGKIAPNVPFNYTFLSNDLNKQYQAQARLAYFFSVSAGIAIVLACLGLFALAVFSTEKRTKEIGIRKVLGASITGIVTLLSKDFLKLVGIGFLIAVPIAWYTMHRWLQNFAYHVHIGIGVFLLAGFLAMVIALLTVSWQSIKAALANPVESLRNE